MTLQEAFEYGKSLANPPRYTALGANQSISDLPRDTTRLLIKHDYSGELPDLSFFPNLEAFSSTLPVTMDYVARQDLTKLKELSLRFENGADVICILAPALERLSLSIENIDAAQLDMFTQNENTIFLANMPKLKELRFSYCTWQKIVVNGPMPSVEKLTFFNQDLTDFSILAAFPNLKELTVTGCTCTDASFVKGLNKLVTLDLSYNYIRDFSPLLELPILETVNVYRNPENDAHLLKEKGCYVIATAEDKSFEQFKFSIRSSFYHAYRYIGACRLPNPARPLWEQRLIDKETDEELFVRRFTDEVKRQIVNYSTAADWHCHHAVPVERLEEYVRSEYPFTSL